MAERAADHQELEHEMLERQRLERALARISDEERRRLGQDVHDGVCQQLTGALLRCQALERRLDRGNAAEAADIAALSCLLEEAIDEAYAVARGLNPLEPEPEALVQALRSLLRRTRETAGTSCEFIASGDTRVADPAAAQHLYRIAQEALSNAVRHAQAGHITVELRGCENELVLRVEDDGAGMPAVPANGGMGLGTMAYRAQAMEGVLVVEPSPDGGTRVICQVPRVSPADEHPNTDGKGRR
jgi:signal transduction histidine kinase